MNVTLELHRVTDQTGVWCDHCQTSSAVTVGFAIVAAESLHTITRFDVTVCERCDGRTTADPP